MKKQRIFAVSGVKNSGKTTLITELISIFRKRNFTVSVIKHDGHDFTPDVPGTDSYKFREAGAEGAAVFSDNRMMIVKEQAEVSEKEFIKAFANSDIIILEGFKYSEYLKVEVVRRVNSEGPVCSTDKLLAVVTDYSREELPEEYRKTEIYGFGEIEELAEMLCEVL